MLKSLLLFGLTVMLTVLFAGCESDSRDKDDTSTTEVSEVQSDPSAGDADASSEPTQEDPVVSIQGDSNSDIATTVIYVDGVPGEMTTTLVAELTQDEIVTEWTITFPSGTTLNQVTASHSLSFDCNGETGEYTIRVDTVEQVHAGGGFWRTYSFVVTI